MMYRPSSEGLLFKGGLMKLKYKVSVLAVVNVGLPLEVKKEDK